MNKRLNELATLAEVWTIEDGQDKCEVDLELFARLVLQDSTANSASDDQKQEQEQKPLSDEKLEIMYSKHAFAMDKQEYMWGFRDAEKAHGIGVDDE